MEKHIAWWSYFVGVAGLVVAVVWRLLTMLQVIPKDLGSGAHAFSYKTLQQGSFMLFAMTVATAAYVYIHKERK